MDLGVAGRSYLIIGGTAGMGLAAARVLAGDGANVAVVGRRQDRAERAAEELRAAGAPIAIGLVGDLTEVGAAERVVAEALDAFAGGGGSGGGVAGGGAGTLRGVAVTTGLGMEGQRDLLRAQDQQWAATFDDVLLSVVRACRAVIPVLIEGGGGSLVTTAAYSIRAPKARQLPYAALKSSVATMSKALAKEYGPHGVRVNCVCPGATESEVLAAMRLGVAEQRGWPVETALERIMAEEWGMNVALGRPGQPEELGDVIAYLLSERSSYVTGALVNVELKQDVSDRARLVARVAALLHAAPGELPPVLCSSFHPGMVRGIARRLPTVPAALLVEAPSPAVARSAYWRALGARGLNPAARATTPALAAAVRARGDLVFVWTVNDGERARALARLGVDGLITDDPRGVLAALG